jgi:transposase
VQERDHGAARAVQRDGALGPAAARTAAGPPAARAAHVAGRAGEAARGGAQSGAHPDARRAALLWIPGIGRVVAFTIWLEIDGIARFPSSRDFVSYCRLVPGAGNSGGKTRHKRAKDGNRYLKLAFSHAAVRAIQYFPEIGAFYRALCRRKPAAVARALVAKELARVVYYVLTKQEAFNGTFKGKPLTRTKQPKWPRLATPPA